MEQWLAITKIIVGSVPTRRNDYVKIISILLLWWRNTGETFGKKRDTT